MLPVKNAHQLFHPLALRIEHAPAEIRQPVIAAARVVELRRGPLLGFGDQLRFDQTFQRLVQRCRPQTDFSTGPIEDLLHDPVAVLLFASQGEKNVEPVRFERKKALRVAPRHSGVYISNDIYTRQDYSEAGHTDWLTST